MSVESLSPAESAADLDAVAPRGFLPLGGSPPLVPDPVVWSDPGDDFSAIVLLGRVEPDDLSHILETAPDPALPIADFGGNPVLRRDFSGTLFGSGSIEELRHAFGPIWRRLAEIPFKAVHHDVTELTILRLAYSRSAPIAASFDPTSRNLVEYPMLGALPGLRNHLETLARLDLLHRRHFARVHSCIKCASARLHVYEACPECGGANLNEQELVHHYRCGCQEVESSFRRGDHLVCPKCRRTLHHLGVDYGKPGKVAVCGACSTVCSDPSVQFTCLDCCTVMSSENATSTDWYHYDLTDEGVRALRQGRLPQFDIAPLLEGRTRIYAPHEFSLLAMHELKVAERCDRPFSVARLTVLNFESLVQKGTIAADAGFQLVADAISNGLRSSDFVGVDTGHSAVIGFPNTSSKDIQITARRIQQAIDAAAAGHVQIGIEVAEGKAIVDLLSRDSEDGRAVIS
jgi:GGDEF domain-containing protein